MDSNFKIWGLVLMLMVVEQKTTFSNNTKAPGLNSTTKVPHNLTHNEDTDSGGSTIILVVFATTSIFSLTLFVVFIMVCCIRSCNNKRQNKQGLNSSTLKTGTLKMYHNELMPKKNNSKDGNTADHVYEDPKLMKSEDEYTYPDQSYLELLENYEKKVLQESASGTQEKFPSGKPLSTKGTIPKSNEYYVNGMLSLKRTTKNEDKQIKLKRNRKSIYL